jgi:DNA-binding transcriptional MerR regulator
MEYTVNKLAKIAGVSARTLRYYDERGLLPTRRNSSNGYRIYGQEDIDRLQQIMFYRELGIAWDEIARILSEPNFEPLVALDDHLAALQEKRERLDALIRNVENSILAMKGEMTMKDSEKFEGFKQKLIDENEQRYGEEIRAKYGNETIDRSNANLKGMSKEKYAESEQLRQELENTLKIACEQGDPAGELSQKGCELHRDWLISMWGDTVAYSKEAHLAMGQMYVDDPRFAAYYDEISPGLAVFLRDALKIYCQ